MKKWLITITIIFSAVCFGSIAQAAPVYNDLWDISQGTTVTGISRAANHTGSLYDSNAGNMFGGTLPTSIEPESLLFEDYNFYSGQHWISWHRTSTIAITDISLFTNTPYHNARSFNEFRLYAWNGSNWGAPIYTYDPNSQYTGTLLAKITPTSAQDFKAEFDWYNYDAWNSGPRITELDAFNTPEPATMSLLGLGLFGLLGFRRKTIKS